MVAEMVSLEEHVLDVMLCVVVLRHLSCDVVLNHICCYFETLGM